MRTWLLAFPLLVAGCTSAPSEAPSAKESPQPEAKAITGEEIASYLPAAGTKLTYVARTSVLRDGVGTNTDEKVTLSFAAGKGPSDRSVSFKGDAPKPVVQGWSAGPDALVLSRQLGRENTPGIPMAVAGKPGEVKSLDANGVRPDGTFGPMKVRIRVESPEEVDFAEGKGQAQPFESEFVWKASGEERTAIIRSWWVRGKGLVRQAESLKSKAVQREVTTVLQQG